jgi:hypothetical protein
MALVCLCRQLSELLRSQTDMFYFNVNSYSMKTCEIGAYSHGIVFE